MANNSFSSGFGAGAGAIIGRDRNRMLQQQQINQQRAQLRAEGDASVEKALTELQNAAKNQSTAFFSETEESGREKIKEIHTRTAQSLWGSTRQMLEVAKQNGLYNDAETANIKEQFRIGATLNNPAAEKKLVAAGEAEGKLPAQKELASFKSDLRSTESAQDSQNRSAFGNSATGLAFDSLLNIKNMKDAGQEPSQEQMNQAIAAEHILNKPRIITAPNGDKAIFTPGVPAGFSVSGESTESKLETLVPDEELGKKRSEGFSIIGNVVDLLEEAKKANEQITGIIGTAKARGGASIARQFGANVSTRAEELDRNLKKLQATLGPVILQEKRLSDTERERLMDIVGGLNSKTDEPVLRETLIDLVRSLEGL